MYLILKYLKISSILSSINGFLQWPEDKIEKYHENGIPIHIKVTDVSETWHLHPLSITQHWSNKKPAKNKGPERNLVLYKFILSIWNKNHQRL